MNATYSKRIAALLLALALSLGLAGCGATDVAPDGTGLEIGDVFTPPAPEGRFSWSDRKTDHNDPEKVLARYGDVETVAKSVKTPSEPATKNASNATQYGTVDWSTAANGYITFTAKGQTRGFLLQGPNTGVQALFEVAKDDSIKVALMDGTGKYQYAIANNSNNGKSYRVMYKNSFSVDKIDADLVPFLVSTPWGDYGNAPDAVKKAAELWDGKKTQLENVDALAKWVKGLKYDKNLKQGTISKYVNPDSVIANGGGVCNELSKLLTAMLRSQGIPAYYQGSSTGNHAWVKAWVELSTSTKNDITYSKGAWVNIEATSGDIQYKATAETGIREINENSIIHAN